MVYEALVYLINWLCCLFYGMNFLEQNPFCEYKTSNKEKNVYLYNICFLLHTFDMCCR